MLEEFTSVLRETSEFLGISPARPLPRRIVIEDVPPEIHGTCSLRKNVLLISKRLKGFLSEVLRKEALSMHIPPEADSVPQVHDLAWAYSGIDLKLWEMLRIKPGKPFENYDPVKMFSLLSEEERLSVIRKTLIVVRASASSGNLDLPTYLSVLNKTLFKEIKLSPSEKRILNILSKNPYADTDSMREAGLSPASISRGLKRLRRMGYLFGPDNVNLWKLGLTTIIVTFPNKKEFRDLFWEFPFTYNQIIPVSSALPVHAYLVLPLEAATYLSKTGLETYVVKSVIQRFVFSRPKDVWEAMSRAFLKELGEGDKEPKPMEIERPPITLSKKDLEIINYVLRTGRATVRALSELGIPSARTRLNRLRTLDVIRKCFMVELPRDLEIFMFKVEGDASEAVRLSNALSAVATNLVQYLEGQEFEGCLGIAFIPSKLKDNVVRAIKALYGDKLLLAEEVLNVHTLWTFPVELWDEKEQKFAWEDSLKDLLTKISKIHYYKKDPTGRV